MTSEVVNNILPSTSRFQHSSALGEAEGLTHQATIHVAHGEMRPLDIGRVLAQLSRQAIRVAIDDAGLNPEQTSMRVTLLDPLHILPACVWLFVARWATAPLIRRNLSIDFEQCFAVSTPTIRDQSGRLGVLAAPFEHRQSLL